MYGHVGFAHEGPAQPALHKQCKRWHWPWREQAPGQLSEDSTSDHSRSINGIPAIASDARATAPAPRRQWPGATISAMTLLFDRAPFLDSTMCGTVLYQ